MRDPGLLVGEIKPSLLQDVSHERLHLITKESLRGAGDQESSGPGEFHPQALADPDGSLSTHPALRSLVTTSWLFFRPARTDSVIPIPVEVVGLHQDRRELFVADLDARRVAGRVQFGLDRQT